jgi:hypothetical protein
VHLHRGPAGYRGLDRKTLAGMVENAPYELKKVNEEMIVDGQADPARGDPYGRK